VEVRVLDTATAEADWIAARLRAERLAGRAWEAMAVVVRSIGLVGPLAAALAAAGVPVAVGWSDIPLADEPVAAALLDGLLARGAGVAEDRVVDLLWAVWTDSGWPERITAGLAGDAAARLAAGRDLDAATALIDLAHARADWRGEAGVALFAEEVAEQAIPVGRARSPEGNRPGVAVLTAHRAKGREWPVVVVAGVQEGLWPNLGRRRGLIRLDHLTDDGRFDEPVFGERLLAERRLFLSAVGRAGESLVVTAVDDGGLGDLAPSRFLATLGVSARLGGEEPGEPVTLTGLVGRLRQAAADPRAHPALRAAAEARLADLADATGADGRALAPAADPARWWGVETGWFSNEDQVVASVLTGVDQWGVAADGVPRISGSQLQALLACPRRWFLDHRARADQGGTPQRRFGSLLHSLAQRLAAGDLDREAASLELDRAWDSVGFTAPWQSLAQRGQAEAALDRHTAWEAAQRGHAVVGLEAPFDTEVRVAGRAVRLVGRIDRIDRERDGRCRIVDFKTGRQAPSGPEVASHLQLGLYQLAVQSGGLVGLVGRDPVLAGAELVFLRLAAGRGSRQPKALRQAGLSAVPQLDPPAQYAALRRGGRDLGLDACGPFPTWVHRALAAAVLLLDEGRFPAVGGPDCVRCAFRGGCPAAAVDEEEAPQ
jgi:RecB family exonuclease